MDQNQLMRILALVALLLYIGPMAFGDRLSDRQRIWMWRVAAAAIAVGVAIALVETVRWYTR